MSTVLASAADERYGFHLLNMLGSVKANSDIFDELVVYDLGLSPQQRRLIEGVRGVEVRTVPPFVPHWAKGRTWKTWIWTHLEADRIFWLDAGATVLRSLAEPLEQVEQRGYFVVGQGQPMRDSVPSDYFGLYGIADALDGRDSIAAGILAFSTAGAFFEGVIVPTFEDAERGRSLGFSADEVAKLNRGLDQLDTVIVRDCRIFRHEQTLLGIHFYKSIPDPWVNDLYEYGGWKSPKDHPAQVIWSHRRRGDYRYLWRVPYTWRVAPSAWLFTARFRRRSWYRQHAWAFRPGLYAEKARRLLRRG